MALSKEEKSAIMEEFKTHESDVGSPEVQVALLTRRIEELSDHMQSAPKDYHSQRGLVLMVARRRKLLNYVRGKDPERYQALIDRLGLRR